MAERDEDDPTRAERDALKAGLASEFWAVFQRLVQQEWGADATLAKIDTALQAVPRGDSEAVSDTVQQIQAARREVLKVLTLPRERLAQLEKPERPARPFETWRRGGR